MLDTLKEPTLCLSETMRKLEPQDYHKGYLELCAVLTNCPELSEAQFHQILAEREAAHWHTWVLQASLQASLDSNWDSKNIIATISLHLERKFYRAGQYVGHVEDVIVHPDFQKHNLGKALVQFATEEAKKMGCYKVILDCDEKLEHFYSKSGLEYSNIQMANYFS